jgi:hypothetical protein
MVRLFIFGITNNGIIKSNFVASNGKWLLTSKLERGLKEVVLS